VSCAGLEERHALSSCRTALPEGSGACLGDSGLQLHQGRCRLDIGKNVFTERVVRPWPRLPRAVGESPALKGFRNHVDVALGDMV